MTARAVQIPKYGQIRTESRLFCLPSIRHLTFVSSRLIDVFIFLHVKTMSLAPAEGSFYIYLLSMFERDILKARLASN